jgi:hypothetical protein
VIVLWMGGGMVMRSFGNAVLCILSSVQGGGWG